MEGFGDWLEALEARHARELTFRELRTGVVALSRIYVQGREKLERGAVFQGRAKRAAFACFYTPMHYLLIRRIVDALELSGKGPLSGPERILDLGCGLGAAGAAWSLAACRRPRVDGIDRNAWAVAEARWNLAELGIRGRVRRGDVAAGPIDRRYDAVVAAFTVNELSEGARDALLSSLLAVRGTVLVVEPVAKKPSPWWSAWARAFLERGGRDDLWRFPAELPAALEKLDRASGLDHRELSGRSLCRVDSRLTRC